MYKKSCKNRLLSFVFFFLFNLFKVSLISLYLALVKWIQSNLLHPFLTPSVLEYMTISDHAK